MIGSIIGDVIGSYYESNKTKDYNFELFKHSSDYTDDTVLTVATAQAILQDISFFDVYQDFGKRYTDRGYGSRFLKWLSSDDSPIDSWGNGSAMRVSPIGFSCPSYYHVISKGYFSAIPTHDSPEGIKGAQATALSIFLAKEGKSKEDIIEEIEENFDYDLSISTEETKKTYKFDVSCAGTVPPAIRAFIDSKDFEDAIRLAVSLGGDADTLASITGGIAQAFYKEIPESIEKTVRDKLPQEFIDIILEFEEKYMSNF
ncbi:MAG: ADP-ribosylglycohydrolase family protein [Clostridiales bacterium]|nr:ADP-ribosylglycohydrolase family protein [Clostridiales bacterium]